MQIGRVSSCSPSFGVKIPTKTVLSVATGRFLENAKVAHPAQMDMLQKVGNLTHEQLYSYQSSEALRNMGNIIKQRHPNVAKSAERINKECDALNRDRTFKPDDERKVLATINRVVREEIRNIGKEEIDIAPMDLKELGYDKSDLLNPFGQLGRA